MSKLFTPEGKGEDLSKEILNITYQCDGNFMVSIPVLHSENNEV